MARRAAGHGVAGQYVRELLGDYATMFRARWPTDRPLLGGDVLVSEDYLAAVELRVTGRESGRFAIYGEQWFQLTGDRLIEVGRPESVRLSS